MIKKIIITGPESTGKTTLAKALGLALSEPVVQEYARSYLDKIDRPYKEEDLEKIAKGQYLAERGATSTASNYLICDTSFLVLKIWSLFKYHRCSDFILNQLYRSRRELFVLTGTEIPWEPDPQRENPEDRDRLYQLYKNELENGKVDFIEVSGSVEARVNLVIEYLEELAKK